VTDTEESSKNYQKAPTHFVALLAARMPSHIAAARALGYNSGSIVGRALSEGTVSKVAELAAEGLLRQMDADKPLAPPTDEELASAARSAHAQLLGRGFEVVIVDKALMIGKKKIVEEWVEL